MRIIIIGGVAAGTSAAVKARRNDEEAEICVYERGDYISYSTCGMPYLIGPNDVSFPELVPRDPAWFKARFNIDIQTAHEVFKIDPVSRTIEVRNLENGDVFADSYDELVLATGSRAAVPPVNGADKEHVFFLKTMEQSLELSSFIRERNVNSAVVIGSGFIGMEIYENLTGRGIKTTLIEAEKSLLPILDRDMGIWIEDYMFRKGNRFILDESVVEISDSSVVTASGQIVDADLIVIAAGVRPESSLALAAGLDIGVSGGIAVDAQMNTSAEHIKAAGDCVQMHRLGTEQAVYRPMGSTANKTGRIAGDQLTGGSLGFRGVLGTGILKFFDLQVGLSGMTENEALERGYDIEVVHNIKENQSKYLPESREMIIKAVADRKNGRLLGVQIIGEAGVDKRLDVFATAMSFKAVVSDFFHLDLCYAPPFSTTKDPVAYTGMILDNAIRFGRKIILPRQLAGRESEYQIIDVRSQEDFAKGHIDGAVNIPLSELRGRMNEIAEDRQIVTHCNKGVSGNAAQNLLINSGFAGVFNLSGGYKNFSIYKKYIAE